MINQLSAISISPLHNLSQSSSQQFAPLIYLLIGLFISGCVSLTTTDDWPASLPDRSLFVEKFQAQKARHPESHPNKLDNHLMWIKRFYLGSPIYSTGWNKMTDTLLDTIQNPADKEALKDRMHVLGIKICVEWAQDNSVRVIDSAAVATWGNGLSTAAERNEQLPFVARVEKDVEALLTGSLDVKQITTERYYPSEDYDDF